MLFFRASRRASLQEPPFFLSARVPFSSVSRSLLPVACRSFLFRGTFVSHGLSA